MIDAGLFFFWPDGMMSHTFVGEGVEPGPTISQLYRLTHTADGHLIYFAASDSEFGGLFRALEHPEWAEDERYSTVQGRIDNRLELEALVLDAFRQWKTDEILARLESEAVPAAPVHSLDAVLEDPQVVHNQSIVEMEIPGAGRIRQPASPARFDKTPASATRAAPRLGEHADEILAGIGIDGEERERLRSEGVAP
jgi:crotonobetainyl-CoA:carnitine CoA-transferase CaiB-like acyl-CoA transferase